MKDDYVNNLATKIYKSHKILFDFVFENKPDVATELYPIFEKKIEESGWIVRSKNKGYARFLTEKLNLIIPRKAQGWYFKENFLFEFDFWWTKKKIVFRTIILQNNEEIRNILCEAIESIPNFKKQGGNKQIVHFQHSWEFDKESKTEIDETEVLDILNKEWSKITEIVNQVEAALLNYKDELLKFC